MTEQCRSIGIKEDLLFYPGLALMALGAVLATIHAPLLLAIAAGVVGTIGVGTVVARIAMQGVTIF